MHISEGVLNGEMLVAGWVVSGIVSAYGLYKLKLEDIPKTAMLSSLFFVGSFVHIPIGPSSVHLLFNGIIGALGGIQAFLAIGIALFFQALLYGFGGIGVLGVNDFVMSFPPVLIWYFLRPYLKSHPKTISFIGGALPVLLSVIILTIILLLSSLKLDYAISLIFLWNLPLMIIEGLISVFMIRFILKYRPNLL